MNFKINSDSLISRCSDGKQTTQGGVFQFILCLISVFLNSCIAQFVPQIEEEKELLVVQGLITDQPEPDTIKLSRSLPLGQASAARPVSGYTVSISDNKGDIYYLLEISPGTYITPTLFKGEIGSFYTLHINSNSQRNNLNYQSIAMEMKPVPPIDSLYYEKTVIKNPEGFSKGINGCQIFLNTYDPQNKCKYFRWNYSETWIIKLLFPVQNRICWITEKSHLINIKSTASFNESKIAGYPLLYISNVTDRLLWKYSIVVNQYSLTEDEYIYWEKIQNIAEPSGGLYDIIPAAVSSNISCIENPDEQILGYFSVSSKVSKRIFIEDNFEGIIDQYPNCVIARTPVVDPPGLGIYVWILDDEPFGRPPYRLLTDKKGCADCTVRGTTVKPEFWQDDK